MNPNYPLLIIQFLNNIAKVQVIMETGNVTIIHIKAIKYKNILYQEQYLASIGSPAIIINTGCKNMQSKTRTKQNSHIINSSTFFFPSSITCSIYFPCSQLSHNKIFLVFSRLCLFI